MAWDKSSTAALMGPSTLYQLCYSGSSDSTVEQPRGLRSNYGIKSFYNQGLLKLKLYI